METKRTNDEVHRGLSKQVISQDIKYQTQQKIIAKAAVPLVNTLDLSYNLKVGQPITQDMITKIRQHSVDSLTLLGCINDKLDQHRRDSIVNALPKEFKPIRKISDESNNLLKC